MPRGQYKRVSSKQSNRVDVAVEETQDWGAPVTSTPLVEVRAAMSLQPLLQLAALAQRMADRCVRGKYGLALENDARAALDLWDSLPDDVRVML